MSVVGVLGGSFDPPHMGHLLLGAWALATGEIDTLLLVPVWAHAFDKKSAPFDDRVAMAKQLAEELGPRADVTELERDLNVPSRTLRTLQALEKARPGDELRLVVGEDILAEVDAWYCWDEVAAMAPPLVAGRLGGPPDSGRLRLADVSSTEVRRRLAAGEDVSSLLPASVARYVREHGLYGAA